MTTEAAATIRAALAAARIKLAGLPGVDAHLDSEVLLASVLGRDRTWLYARREQRLEPVEAERFERLVGRRARGVPVAHLIGTREFWSLPLKVTAETLVPRPDTELLVEWALDCLRATPGSAVLDLGTGTGAIALALAHERQDLVILATDRSTAALQVARANRAILAMHRVVLLQGDWFSPFAPRPAFDLIVSNPPYVAKGDPHLTTGDVVHEPRDALVAGSDGLAALRQIIQEAPARLRPGGRLLLEHGAAQGGAVRALLQAAGFLEVETRRDLAGLERASGGRRP